MTVPLPAAPQPSNAMARGILSSFARLSRLPSSFSNSEILLR